MNVSKEALRAQYGGCAPPATYAGKIAEQIRRMAEYRNAKTILMMPSPLLFQARINCLLDGKVLLMPSPALKSGFYRVKPFSIPFPDLAHGTSLKGITLFGRKVQGQQLQKIEIDLALTGCVALDQKGQRLGEGTGFFDLSMGLLGTIGSITEKTLIGCVADALQVSQDDLVCDPWDVPIDFMVQLDGETSFARVKTIPSVIWDALSKKQIRKIEPLWQLYCELFPLDNEDVQVEQEASSPWSRSKDGKG
ncbi:MAG: hypothetical protein PF442_09020 [Desulfobulbaceae bacterium]|jgi:5-formyltetrahydrofolate cyclo-ligase|nr:hypothetical protein [Desulfobulbaceae bacterium]